MAIRDSRHRSSAWPLAWASMLVIVYASLYPFEGWRWPEGRTMLAVLELPWMRRFSNFDEWSNLLGYVPTGALLYLAIVRSGGSVWAAVAVALVGPAALSYVMEVLQTAVPRRVPSLRDWAWNSGGAATGTLLGAVLQATGALALWQRLRARWLLPGGGWALTLLALWPMALLFPAPVPFGLGQVADVLRDGAQALVSDTTLAAWLQPWLQTSQSDTRMSFPREALAIALGLLAPCLLVFSVTPRGWRRLLLAASSLALGFGMASLSAALNFSPEHALAWVSAPVPVAFGWAALVALCAAFVGVRLVAVLGVVAVTALLAIVSEAPADPYFAASLSGWEQGRFVRFHGVAQWVGWLWPYAALGWFAALLIQRKPAGP